MKTIVCTLSILVFSLAVSCRKKVAEVNADYVGSWQGYDTEKSYSLTIEPNSKSVYATYQGVKTVTVKGQAKIKGSTLKVFTKRFKINQQPLQDQAQPWKYTMVLNGITYQR